jgi:hypothetical protein
MAIITLTVQGRNVEFDPNLEYLVPHPIKHSTEVTEDTKYGYFAGISMERFLLEISQGVWNPVGNSSELDKTYLNRMVDLYLEHCMAAARFVKSTSYKCQGQKVVEEGPVPSMSQLVHVPIQQGLENTISVLKQLKAYQS